jgi:cholesterol transport system auxiliary component
MKRIIATTCLLLVAGCSLLNQKDTPHPSFHSLDSVRTGSAKAAASVSGPTLIVNPPHASAGFDSRRIIYLREPHRIEYFAHNEWVDTPARMLAPLIVSALENVAAFNAVVLTPSAAAGDLRLDTEVLRLQQQFDTRPSVVRFTLRATLVDVKTRSVLGSRELDAVVPAASDNPRGGVAAANRAVETVMAALGEFCAAAARNPPRASVPTR